MTLLQILIVRPGNLLVKNHESLSINNESQLKKTRSTKLKMLGPLCNQTDAKTLHYSLLELNIVLLVHIKSTKKTEINRRYYIAARRYTISLRVLKNISRVSASERVKYFF